MVDPGLYQIPFRVLVFRREADLPRPSSAVPKNPWERRMDAWRPSRNFRSSEGLQLHEIQGLQEKIYPISTSHPALPSTKLLIQTLHPPPPTHLHRHSHLSPLRKMPLLLRPHHRLPNPPPTYSTASPTTNAQNAALAPFGTLCPPSDVLGYSLNPSQIWHQSMVMTTMPRSMWKIRVKPLPVREGNK